MNTKENKPAAAPAEEELPPPFAEVAAEFASEKFANVHERVMALLGEVARQRAALTRHSATPVDASAPAIDALRSIRDLAALDASKGGPIYYRKAENALAQIECRHALPAVAPVSHSVHGAGQDERARFEGEWCNLHKPMLQDYTTDAHGDYSDASLFKAWRMWQARAALAAPISPSGAEAQPVKYESRMRPTWVPEGEGWSAWTEISEAAYHDQIRVPLLSDWQYEARALYTAPVAPKEAQRRIDACLKAFEGVSTEDIEESKSVLETLTTKQREINNLHRENVELRSAASVAPKEAGPDIVEWRKRVTAGALAHWDRKGDSTPVEDAMQEEIDDLRAAIVAPAPERSERIPQEVGMGWISVIDRLPPAIEADDGTFPCSPIDSVICAIWSGTWLQAWAKQRYCADGQWRQGDSIGFIPTHWQALGAPVPAARRAELQRDSQTLQRDLPAQQAEWVSVPVEMTDDMQDAFSEWMNDFVGLDISIKGAKEMFSKVIAAAPSAMKSQKSGNHSDVDK